MIAKRTILCLGTAQLVSWGTSYYLVGIFGDAIVAGTGWSRSLTHGGFSAGLLAMALASPWAGRLVDRHGGRPVLAAGSLLNAAACIGLALSHHPAAYYLAWIVLGLSMRLTLYDAAFAALARIGGSGARRAMAQITLLGGLASTAFWPLGHSLIEWLDWRSALVAYGAIALAVIPLYLAIPAGARPGGEGQATSSDAASRTAADRRLAGWLYAAIMALVAFLNSGMSAHMIGMLAGLGLGTSTAVWVASLRGAGQTAARACDLLFGARVSPLGLNVLAASLLVGGFLLIPAAGGGIVQAMVFAFAFGAGNGLMTITRGALPLTLLGPKDYGSVTGRLLAPSFVLSAAAPVVLGFLIERYGNEAALIVSVAIVILILGLALALRWRFSTPPRPIRR